MFSKQFAIVAIVFGVFTSIGKTEEIDEAYERSLENYCESDSLPDDVHVAFEACLTLGSIDFQGFNPYTTCKQSLFTNGESNDEIRQSLCSQDDSLNQLEDCVLESIKNHSSFSKFVNDRLACVRGALPESN